MRNRKVESHVRVAFTQALNERGLMADCVILTCNESEESTQPIWGQSPKSIKRGLAIMSRTCGCHATWHNCDEELISDERQAEFDRKHDKRLPRDEEQPANQQRRPAPQPRRESSVEETGAVGWPE